MCAVVHVRYEMNAHQPANRPMTKVIRAREMITITMPTIITRIRPDLVAKVVASGVGS